MSFSVEYFGKPEALKRRIEKHSSELTGESKAEFDSIVPALLAVIDQNVSSNVDAPPVLKVRAHGHASFNNGVKTYGNCTVEVAPVGYLVE